jgi:hypothetical protein
MTVVALQIGNAVPPLLAACVSTSAVQAERVATASSRHSPTVRALSAETGCDHGRRRPDMHVEVEVQERALELLIAAPGRPDIDRTRRRHEDVLVRRRRRLCAPRNHQDGPNRQGQRDQDHESPHHSTFRERTNAFISRRDIVNNDTFVQFSWLARG